MSGSMDGKLSFVASVCVRSHMVLLHAYSVSYMVLLHLRSVVHALDTRRVPHAQEYH